MSLLVTKSPAKNESNQWLFSLIDTQGIYVAQKLKNPWCQLSFSGDWAVT